jgi:hypothetical protein
MLRSALQKKLKTGILFDFFYAKALKGKNAKDYFFIILNQVNDPLHYKTFP